MGDMLLAERSEITSVQQEVPRASQRSRLKIVHINAWDRVGGAARSAFRLHQGLRALGHESRMLVGFCDEDGSDNVQSMMAGWPVWKKVLRRAALGFERLSGMQYLFLWWSDDFVRHSFTNAADLVHLHNLHGNYISHTILPKLSHQVPVMWTLHDMWALTGHCAYAYDCQRWTTGCGQCPIITDYPALPFDTTAILWRLKRWIYHRSNVTIVSPSRWLAERVRQSPLLGRFDVHWIPYGLDTKVFRPVPKTVARQALDLPADAKIVLFVAAGLSERRKGAAYLLEALQRVPRIAGKPVWVLIVGSQPGEVLQPREPLVVRHLGSIVEDQRLALCYVAADLCVLPTLADNLPNVLLESLACGTPTVAFRTGGVPEVVRHMETGYVAEHKDPNDLARGIHLLLSDAALRTRMGHRCREIAEREYSMELQAQRYGALYQDAIEQHRAHENQVSHRTRT